MGWLSKVLVPVEFSPRCLGSVQYAEALATHLHCNLTLLHVVRPPYMPYSAPDVAAYASVVDLDAGILDEAQKRLNTFPIDTPDGTHVERAVSEGDPAATIVDFAHEGGYDLIVMPTHGYGPFRRFLLGSVTAKVLHDACCPVWTGPHMENAPAHDSVGFHTILCALDLQSESRAVLAWGAALARECGSKLHVVHVLPASTVGVGGLYFDPAWHDSLVSRAKAEIGRIQRELQTEAKPWIQTGETPETIKEAVRRLGADLLVIGRGRHSGPVGRLRTNAYAILRESPCPTAAI